MEMAMNDGEKRQSVGRIKNRGAGAPRSRGWYKGKNLPHYDQCGVMQFITFRLCDSLPGFLVEQLEDELNLLKTEERDIIKRKRIEDWIDVGHGCCALSNPEMAEVMENALLHFDGERYNLISWCIMPNHVHVLISTENGLSRIVQSWKSFTGRWAYGHLDDDWLPGNYELPVPRK